MSLDGKHREKILDRVSRLVETKYFDPDFDPAGWRERLEGHREGILGAASDEAFEQGVHDLVSTLGTSHTAFFHRNLRPVPARQAICATLNREKMSDGPRWMFADVQEEGAADLAGIRPGDLLLALNGKGLSTEKPPQFRVGDGLKLGLRRLDCSDAEIEINVPKPKSSNRPFSLPQSVVHRKLDTRTGYLKVNMFPGLVGIDVSRDIDQAVASFQDCNRIVIDLRGNSGGGIGCLRLMSYLTPDRVPVGYSLTRARARRGYEREQLTRFSGIPASKWQLPLLALRYAFVDHSIVLVTEGLGAQPFHGRIAILVNQHSASAAEMVAAFAQQNKLGRIVGVKTPGRLVGSRPFKLPEGYFLVLPVGAYFTWEGQRLEGVGVTPDVDVDLSRMRLVEGTDSQIRRALEVLGSE